MSGTPPHSYRFDDFVVEPRTARLSRGGESLAVEPKVFDILVYLLEHRDRLVDRRELLDAVWGGTFVTENALTRAVARLRGVLGDDAHEPRFLGTVHSRGYRFLVPVVVDAAETRSEARPEPADPTARRRRPGPWHLAAAAAVPALLAVAFVTLPGAKAPAPSAPDAARGAAVATLDRQRIAVLPMVDLSDTENGYFADGLTEEIISVLSRIEGVRVVPRTSIMAYKGTDKRIGELAAELGAGTVLEGSVRRQGARLRITVQLIDAEREEYLWSEQFDRPVADIFAVQSEVASRVAAALRTMSAPGW